MRPRSAYLLLCVVGTILPYSALVPFFREHGLNATVFVQQLFATPVSAFFGLDVIVSSIVLWTLVFYDGRARRMKHLWAPIAANLAVGVSLGLPLFLYLRETQAGAFESGQPRNVPTAAA
jgi:hypothetical protein